MKTEFVSHSYTCPTETRNLGEDLEAAESVGRRLNNFRLFIGLQRSVAKSKALQKMLADLDQFFVDADHDCSVTGTIEEAREAAAEAKVVPMFRNVTRADLKVVL